MIGERKFKTFVGDNTTVIVYFDYTKEDKESNCEESVTINTVYDCSNKDIKESLSDESLNYLEIECFDYVKN